MRTLPFILMLVIIGAVAAWQSRGLLAESLWYGAPMLGGLIFAAVFHRLLQRPDGAGRRRALLFGIGVVAFLASVVFGAFAWTCLRLVTHGSRSFDGVWIAGAVGAGALAVWLWFRFYRIARQK
jgi:hypothetical protein